LDAAAGRCGFFTALAAHQAAIRTGAAEAGADQRRAQSASRARYLAAAVLEHLIRDEADYTRHVEYCYINPVKHGLVSRVRDWPHSSFHRDVRAGIIPDDWAGDVDASGAFGER